MEDMIKDDAAPENVEENEVREAEHSQVQIDDGVVERIEFDVTKKHVEEHLKINAKAFDVIAAGLSLLGGFFVGASEQSVLAGVITAVLAFVLFKVYFSFRTKKQTEKSIKKLDSSAAEYLLKEDFIEYYGREQGELVHFRRIRFDDIVSVRLSATSLNFIADGISYFIPSDALPEESKLLARLAEAKKINATKGARKIERGESAEAEAKKSAFTKVAYTISILSVVAYIVLIALDKLVTAFWIPLCTLALPAAYFVFYAISKRRKIPMNGAFTFLAIASAVVMIVMSLSVQTTTEYNENEALAKSTFSEFTELTDRALPQGDDLYCYEQRKYIELFESSAKVTTATMYLDQEDDELIEGFEESVFSDPAWISKGADAVASFTDVLGEYCVFDKIIIYNSTSGTYNEPMSSESATYYIITYTVEYGLIELYRVSLE